MMQVGSLADSVKDALASKASSTLHSRANPMFRFLTFCNSNGLNAFPIIESVVYAFLKLQDFAPTFPRSFIIRLAFSLHVLGLRGDRDVLTGRTKGVAHEWFLKKRKLVQRPPLSVQQVVALEQLVIDDSKTVKDRIAAGFFAFVLYCRARYSDALRIESLKLDIALREGQAYGFLEAETSRTKTSSTLEKKTRFLPMTCTLRTVSQTQWVEVWLKLRKTENLESGHHPSSPFRKWDVVQCLALKCRSLASIFAGGNNGPPGRENWDT